MTRRFASAMLVALVATACSGTPPTTPKPPIVNPPTDAPVNAVPTIDGISVKGRRPGQPDAFADVRDVLDITATVRDPETPLEQLIYQWTATAGTIAGTGRVVTWTAPDATSSPAAVTITLKVIEQYGHPGQAKTFSHEVSSTATVQLHDSAAEVGQMAVRFLTAFSMPQTIKDWREVMGDFSEARCPHPNEVRDEREQVINHYNGYVMNSYAIGPPSVSVRFGGACRTPSAGEFLSGDACAEVRVHWDSTGAEGRLITSGVDLLSAVYVPDDRRWWLCSSRYLRDATSAPSFYSSAR